MNHMAAARKEAALIKAKAACAKDDEGAFEQAMLLGVDVRADVGGRSMLDMAVAYGAAKCLALILPHFNATSGSHAKRFEEIAQGEATGAIPGYQAPMGFSGQSTIVAMSKVARSEIDRQKGHVSQWEAMALDASAKAPERPKRRNSL